MTFRLPPSQRGCEVFFEVAFYSVSTRHAAGRFKISQTRVRQLVTLVGDWVAENLPDFGEADLKKQVRLAQHVAANRLEHQYEQAMNYWNAEGDPKHLRQATRIALAQSGLGVVAGRVQAIAANVSEGPLELGDLGERGRDQESGAGGQKSEGTLVTRVHPGNASPRGSTLAGPESRQEPRGSGFPGGSLGTSGPTVGDCSVGTQESGNGGHFDSEDLAANDCPETLIERERQSRLMDMEGILVIERRLLSLIENQGNDNPERLASLQHTLSRVRAEKATAELRLAPFLRGVQINPVAAEPANQGALAAR